MYKIVSFKGKHIVKSNMSDGSPYKATSCIAVVEKNKDFIVWQYRLVKAKEQPDEWHTFARKFRGENYWHQSTAIRLEKFIQLAFYIENKMIDIENKMIDIEYQINESTNK